MKARPSMEKRRRELKLQERRQDKAEKRRLRKEAGPVTEGDDATLVTADASQIADDSVKLVAPDAPSTKVG